MLINSSAFDSFLGVSRHRSRDAQAIKTHLALNAGQAMQELQDTAQFLLNESLEHGRELAQFMPDGERKDQLLLRLFLCDLGRFQIWN